jgi:hypothetical protein
MFKVNVCVPTNTMLVVVVTDCISSCKSNYHTLTTTTVPSQYIYYKIQNWTLKYGIKQMYNKHLKVNVCVPTNYVITLLLKPLCFIIYIISTEIIYRTYTYIPDKITLFSIDCIITPFFRFCRFSFYHRRGI